MKRSLVIICIVLSALFFSSGVFTGCTSKKAAFVEEDPNTVPKDTYEINWYFCGEPLKDAASVEAAVNDYLKDTLNVTVKLNRIDINQYPEKMNALIASGEYYDIAFCAHWMLDYRSKASTGVWIPLNNYLDKYMPKTKAMLGDDILENVKVNGNIYALPANKEMANQMGWGYREDIAVKYNIDMNSIKDFEALLPVLQKIKENEPEMQYPIDWDYSRTPLEFLQFDAFAYPAAMFPEKYPGKVVNVIETPEYETAIRMARRYYEAGMIRRDVVTATDFDQRLKDGKIFCYVEFLKPGKATEVAKNFSFSLAQAGITPVVESSNAGTGSMMAISKSSLNPTRVMRFLEMFNNDKTLNNLITYGIEGKHYTKIDDKYIKIIPDTEYTLSGSQWMMGNVFLNYLTVGEQADKMEKLKEFNEIAIKPQNYGFNFNPKPVQKEITACALVKKEMNNQVVLGATDIDEILPLYKDKMNAAGAQKIVAEAQRQFNEWKKTKKR